MSAILSKSSSGVIFSKVPKTFRVPNVICKTPSCLLCKGGLFICCKGNKNENNCVSQDALALKIQRELCQPKCVRKVSGLSGNRPRLLIFLALPSCYCLVAFKIVQLPCNAGPCLRELNPSLGMIIIGTNSTNLLPVGYSGIR